MRGNGLGGEGEGARPVRVARSVDPFGHRKLTRGAGLARSTRELEVPRDAIFETRDRRRIKNAAAGENLAECPASRTGPGAERRDELFAVDGTALKGLQTEAQVA